MLALIAVGLELLVKTLILQAFSIPSVSMETTLAVGVLGNPLAWAVGVGPVVTGRVRWVRPREPGTRRCAR